MFAQWRVTLRQAEEAVRADRLEEALVLARRPEVAEHRQAGELRNRIANRLVERARDHVRQGQSQAAWRDLEHAERAGAPSDRIVPLRAELVERGAKEIRAALDAGDPVQAMGLADALRNRAADSHELRLLHEAAACWARANRQVHLGDLPRAVEGMETARNLLGDHKFLNQRLEWCRGVREQVAKLRRELQGALVSQNWAEVLRASEAILDLAPECREVKQTRDEALRRLGVHIAVAPHAPPCLEPLTPVRAGPETKNGSRARFILWVDGVGGFLVCQGNVVTLGQANPGTTVDIPILGDLSRQHATIVRDGEGYLIRSDRGLVVNGRSTEQVALRHGDSVRLGRTVELKFLTPCPVSGTARLDLISRHRLHLSLAGILLMADTCVIGPAPQTHVQVPGAASPIVIYRQGEGLCCRGQGTIEVDGQAHEARAPLQWTSRVMAGDVSLSLEPLRSPLFQV